MKLKDLVTDIKTYIFLFLLVVAVVAGITGWHKIPKKVEENTKGVEQVTKGVVQISNTFDKYIMRQTIYEENADKRADIMFKLLIKDK